MPRILTVEDSRAIRLAIGVELSGLGLDVDEAEDGVQGLSRLNEVKYDLVILDVTMPNLDGPSMLSKMREAGISTPVMMLTSESKKSIMMELMKSGIVDYVIKPFKTNELKTKVAKILDLSSSAELASAPAKPGSGTLLPAADILETDSAIEIHIDLPGVNPDDLDVQVEGGMLTVSAERKPSKTDGKTTMRRQERRFGRYFRSFPMPDNVNPPEAAFRHGVLTLMLAKKEMKPQSVKVKITA